MKGYALVHSMKLSKKDITFLNNHTIQVWSLDLSDQNLEDEDIEMICNNKQFASVHNFNLRNNSKLTNLSIDYIRKSSIIGSFQSGPSISGKYGLPNSTIEIRIAGTSITYEEVEPYSGDGMDEEGFHMDYINDTPVDYAVKEITLLPY